MDDDGDDDDDDDNADDTESIGNGDTEWKLSVESVTRRPRRKCSWRPTVRHHCL